MFEVKVIKGQLNLFKNSILQFKIGHDIVYADLNNDENLILITNDTGKVELREISGKFIRNIGEGNTHIAKWLGNHVALVNDKGVTEYRRISNLIPCIL
jgi:hypothetical protein